MSPTIDGPNPFPDDLPDPHFDDGEKKVRGMFDLKIITSFHSLQKAEINWKALDEEVSQCDPHTPETLAKIELLSDVLNDAKKYLQANKPTAEDLALIGHANNLMTKFNNLTLEPKNMIQVMSVSELLYASKLTPDIINDTTLFGVDVADIPSHQLFISETGYAFDVDELEIMMDKKGKLTNVYTKRDFTPDDLENLKAFEPINSHPVFKTLVYPEAAFEKKEHLRTLAKQVSFEAKLEIGNMAKLFYYQYGPGNGVKITSENAIEQRAEALIHLKRSIESLEPEEKKAIEELSMEHTYKQQLSEAIEDLLDGSTNAQYTDYFENLANLLYTY